MTGQNTPAPDTGTPTPAPATPAPDTGTPTPAPATPAPDTGTPTPAPATPAPATPAPATPAPATPAPDTGTPASEFPKTIDDYKLDRPDIPEGAFYNEELEQIFIKSAFEAKIPSTQAKSILNEVSKYFFDTQKNHIDTQKANAQKLDNDLKSEWGINVDANIKIAQNAARQFGITDTQADKMATLLGDAELLKAFHKIGLIISEDSFVGSGGSSGMNNKDRLESELKTLKAEPDYQEAMTNRGHPKHSTYKDKVNAINKQLAGMQA